MKLHINLKRAAVCIAAILPIAILAFTVGIHAAVARQHPHRAPGPRTNAHPQSTHHPDFNRRDHLIGWIDHLVVPFTSIAANL
jgi:hypothetical protein